MTPRAETTATPLPDFDPERIYELDVRETLRAGGEPRSEIVAAADGLPAGHVLHLRTTFRPEPLLRLMEGRGFHHHTAMFGESDWSTWFWKTLAPPTPAPLHTSNSVTTDDAEDLRLLSPPEPMLRILERITADSSGFDVLLPFYPEPLVPLLIDAAWSITLVEEASDGVRVRLTPLTR
jgi:Uncharacterized conserved protein (DUF2249)